MILRKGGDTLPFRHLKSQLDAQTYYHIKNISSGILQGKGVSRLKYGQRVIFKMKGSDESFAECYLHSVVKE